MGNPRSYGEVLKQLEIPEDTPETFMCKMCGEPMHLLKINRLICFWIHRGESVKVCMDRNVLHKGYPLIRRDLGIYKNIKRLQDEVRKDE